MQKTLECIQCKKINNIKALEVKRSRMVIGDSEYICNYYICPGCEGINLFSIDNEVTNKIFEELQKDNQKIKTWMTNKCEVTSKMKQKNIKLRLKYNLLQQTLYNKIVGKDYQLLSDNNLVIKTGKLQLPNFESERR